MEDPGLIVMVRCPRCTTNGSVCFGFGIFDFAEVIAGLKCGSCKQVQTIDKIKLKNCIYSYEIISTDLKKTVSENIVVIQDSYFTEDRQFMKLEFKVGRLPEHLLPKIPKNIPNVPKPVIPRPIRNINQAASPDIGQHNDSESNNKKVDDGLDGLAGISDLLDDIITPTPTNPSIMRNFPKAKKKIDDTQKDDNFRLDDSEIKLGKIRGKGMFGTVYEAKWIGSGGGIDVAVKEIPIIDDNNESVIMKEFKIITRMIYHRVIRVYGYTLSEGKIRIVMDLFDSDIRNLFSKKDLTIFEKFEIMEKMTQGLNFLHARKTIHRDVKSLNFLQRKNGEEVVITDFGISLTLQRSMTHQQGNFKGTVRWMAPELMIANPVYRASSDIYSLGMTFYELIFETIPFINQKDDMAVMYLIKTDGIKPKIGDPNLPSCMKEMIVDCLKTDPKRRPTTKQLLERFEENREMMRMRYNHVIKFKVM